jgi:hypothetical protein
MERTVPGANLQSPITRPCSDTTRGSPMPKGPKKRNASLIQALKAVSESGDGPKVCRIKRVPTGDREDCWCPHKKPHCPGTFPGLALSRALHEVAAKRLDGALYDTQDSEVQLWNISISSFFVDARE